MRARRDIHNIFIYFQNFVLFVNTSRGYNVGRKTTEAYVMHKSRIPAAVLCLLLLSGCAKAEHPTADTASPIGGISATGGAASQTGDPAETATPETLSDRPIADTPTTGDYTPAGETVITFGETVTVEGAGAEADGTTVTITRAGTYLVSGTLAGGQLIVDTADTEKVVIVLNGASLSSSDGPAVLIKSAPKKAVLYTAAGSINILSDGAGYVVPDEEQVEGGLYPDACIYACDDIELDGLGELCIMGNADKGINTKDDLKVKGGTVTVQSVGVGLRGNDSLEITGGTLTVTSGGDGLKTANIEKEGKGYLAVSGGAVYVTSKGDGLSAATDLSVTGGVLVINTLNENGEALKESSGNPTSGSGGMGGGFGGGRPGGMFGEGNSDKASISAKGLKAAGDLTVAGGKITVVAQDDGMHADKNVTVSDGTLHIRAADDGMHAEEELVISGGVCEIAQSYEGLEALHITISGGTNRVTASDDGANATSGEGGGMGGMPGGRPGMWGGSSSGSLEFSEEHPCLTFTGGYTVFNAGGDGVDSNGWIKVQGGTVLVYGPTDNGNGPIDTGDGGYTMTVSGGTFLAVGSSGMAETADNGGQAVLAAYWNRTGLSAGDTVGIIDGDGKVIAAFELPKSIASIVFSSPDIAAGKTYSVVGGGIYTGEATDGVIDPAAYTGYEVMGEIEAY